MQEHYSGKDQIQVANGAGLSNSHIGNTRLAGSRNSLVLINIRHVPHIRKHLISVHRLVSDNNAFIEFHPDCFIVKDNVTKKIMFRGSSQGGLYPILFNHAPFGPQVFSITKKKYFHMWHHPLGHPSQKIVKTIVRTNSLPCMLYKLSLLFVMCVNVLKVINCPINIHIMLVLHLLN